jgi:hypothetical protein
MNNFCSLSNRSLFINFVDISTCIFTFYLHLILQLERRVVTIDGYSDVPPNDEKKLLKAVAVQPVSVGICGSARALQFYSEVN